MFGKKYILKNMKPVPCEDILEWGKWLERANRRVADVEIGGVRVSTVFLCLDHNFAAKGPPLLFETMVFGGKLDEKQVRYSTWEGAIAGHNEICEEAFEVRGRSRTRRKVVPRDAQLGDPATRLIREG